MGPVLLLHNDIYLGQYYIMVRKTRRNRNIVHKGRIGCEKEVSYILISCRRGHHLLKHAVTQSFQTVPVEVGLLQSGLGLRFRFKNIC